MTLGTVSVSAFAAPPPPWHALVVRAGAEFETAARIEADLNLEVYCPRFHASWVHRGRVVTRNYPYLGPYLLARWDAANARLWHALRAVAGVASFVEGVIRDREIAALREKVIAYAPVPSAVEPRPHPPLGAAVRLVNHPFAGFDAVVARPPGRAPVVAVEIFGLLRRDVVVEVPLECVELNNRVANFGLKNLKGTQLKRKRAAR